MVGSSNAKEVFDAVAHFFDSFRESKGTCAFSWTGVRTKQRISEAHHGAEVASHEPEMGYVEPRDDLTIAPTLRFVHLISFTVPDTEGVL